MIVNADNYLLLKQLLVTLKVVRFKGDIYNGTQKLSEVGLISIIDKLVTEIDNNFTVPYFVLNKESLIIDFHSFNEGFSLLCGDAEEGSELYGYMLESSKPESMTKIVLDYPMLSQYITPTLSTPVDYPFNKEQLKTLVNNMDNGLNVIVKEWVRRENENKSLTQILILLNSIELVDRLFEYCNDYYGARDVNSSESH